VFSQTWYAVCRSEDVKNGCVLGKEFLGGRVVVYRDRGGAAHVQSAFCPHVGANLALGTVTEEGLQCRFHHWVYAGDGRCVRTGIGDPPPPTACLFTFPVREALGVIWAFNGDTPLFELAEPTRPASALLMHVAEPMRLSTDPWVVCANTPDWVHFAMVHRFQFARDGQNESLIFEPFGVRRHFTAALEHGSGPDITFDVCVRGTTQVLIEGCSQGKWFGVAACMGVPAAGYCDFHVVTMVDSSAEASNSAAQAALGAYVEIGRRMLDEDAPIWNTIHFKPGTLTRSDAALSRYLDDLRRYPRAHPSAEFIA
jgi:phenylpropionate dioxygenase-like ring-hydroxylating dioxygenase large terminal subunit